MSYRDLETKLAPGWLQQANGAKLLGELGGVKDDMLDRARQAVLVNLLNQGPGDALETIGAERQLPRAANETPADSDGTTHIYGPNDAAYAARLRSCWDAADGWSFAGSHGGLLKALNRAGFPKDTTGTNIVQRTKRYSWLDTDGVTVHFGTHGGFTWDATGPEYWNRFGLIFGTDVVGLSSGTPLADVLNTTVTLWKPAKALYMGAWVFPSGIRWGWPLTLEWGVGGHTWGEAGGTNRFIPPP